MGKYDAAIETLWVAINACGLDDACGPCMERRRAIKLLRIASEIPDLSPTNMRNEIQSWALAYQDAGRWDSNAQVALEYLRRLSESLP